VRHVFAGLLVAAAIGIGAVLTTGAAGVHFAALAGSWGNELTQHLQRGGPLSGWKLLAGAALGGLAASISPCILGMLPVNLSFIGASRLESPGRAVAVASMFVFGVGVVNVILGIVSSLFFAVFVEHRAEINIGVGLLTVLMALWLGGILRIRTPQLVTKVPVGGGAFAAGLAFALVASPCASPVLVTVLGMAARQGSMLQTALAMGAYTLGYTALLFFASLSAALAVASRRLLAYGSTITRWASAAMLAIGIWTVFYGFSLM
jgi:cytochrome c-type biogenesis protein